MFFHHPTAFCVVAHALACVAASGSVAPRGYTSRVENEANFPKTIASRDATLTYNDPSGAFATRTAVAIPSLTMSGVISRRLFPLLQLTRMALVFTAISNSLCTLIIATRARYGPSDVLSHIPWHWAAAVVAMSTGLYGFGMSLNDIIDRRRDQQLAAHRPLPSGRIGVLTAHVICGLLIALAVGAGALYAKWSGQGWPSLVLVVWTAMLIVFYDYAAKYLVALGLLSLGLIRFFHAVVPAPSLPLLWHPLLLLNHVTILSLIAYRWEEKRPPLTPIHWTLVPG